MMKYKIAYIDEDDGWISTFYHTFKNYFEIIKVKIDAESSIESIVAGLFDREVDAIITDYLLEEEGDVSFNGNKIVDAIRCIKPHFPIIMLTSYEPQAINQMDDVHIIYGKSILDGESQDELELFRTKILATITNYYTKIKDTQSRIENLVDKKNEIGLTILEEEELTKLFLLMDEFEPEGKGLPANLILRESITKLHEFVAETKKVLDELKKAKKEE